MGQLIGYVRISGSTHGIEPQCADLHAVGVAPDNIFVDHGGSRAQAPQPGLDAALGNIRDGDTLVVSSLDRFGASTVAVLALAALLRGRGASLRILSLGGANVNTNTATGSMVFTVMAALAEMERSIKRERNLASSDARRAAGRKLGGRKEIFTAHQIRTAQQRITTGQTATQVAKDLHMSRATLYRRIAAARP